MSGTNPATPPPAFHVIIPARYGSSRFPGKPLAPLAGRAMILRVVDQALLAGAQSVVVATDDERIARAVANENLASVQALMTRPDHPSGSDRIMEAARTMGLADSALLINVQGDEPLIPPEAIRQVANMLAEHPDMAAATLSEPILQTADLFNPNVVKVVSDDRGRALYFSRSAIPYLREGFSEPATLPETVAELPGPDGLWQRHIGIYGYRMATLARFVSLPVAALESAESLEQLRLLSDGISLAVSPSCVAIPGGIDTPEDLARIELHLASVARQR